MHLLSTSRLTLTLFQPRSFWACRLGSPHDLRLSHRQRRALTEKVELYQEIITNSRLCRFAGRALLRKTRTQFGTMDRWYVSYSAEIKFLDIITMQN